ncbi:MAG: restriction endonuclease subunit S [Lachnospiraceae bacterium]|nr:restriction endonuclease subunit S [Butyrivibrio sp.]MCM1342323.1 restriction endonuclease subunit S [Muribaculaceae bacterium]MCM1410909.1 restriction endonuclease subunit S [Lachnospiraceae bacterium]
MTEWTEYELGQLLSYEQPTPFIVESANYNDKFEIPVLTAGKSFIIGYTDEKEGIYDTLPVIIFDDFTTSTQYVNFPFKVKSSAMKILTPNENVVLPKFVYYRMQVIEFDYSTHKRYWIQQYSKLKIKIPSIEEQKRIVDRVEELFSKLDKCVETLKVTKAQLTVYRQAVLKEAFEGKWHYSNRHQPETDLQFDSIKVSELDKLEEIPCEWKYVYLSSLGELSRGRSKHRPRNDKRLFENGKYPFFQTGDVKAARDHLVVCDKMYGEFGLEQSRLWPAGTLCITIAANIAETCFLGVDGCFPDSIVGFTADEKIVNKEYIRFFIEASKKRLWAFAPATAQKNINLTTLENLIVPYCTLDEQEYIVGEIKARLSVCDRIEQTVDTALQQVEAMRRSILKQAFEHLC